jgi:pilus assembly protein Flp/PilA
MTRRMTLTLEAERGASAAEYALLVSLIAVVVLSAVTAFGLGVSGLFDSSCSGVAAVSGQSC